MVGRIELRLQDYRDEQLRELAEKLRRDQYDERDEDQVSDDCDTDSRYHD